MPYPYASDKEEVLSRLRKIEGQIRGIQRMVADQATCTDILTQVSAVVSGMEKVGLRLLREHTRSTVAEAIKGKGNGDDQVDEVVKVVERFLQS
ncbi:MAG TPA: metal-sensitive transcriptional regulator [Actinomycetota bacterium]|jgi:DNA-binding FrmR family transcriptional regulator|nr:metal-sensitive transcriptional regulator [Actinomycetota bacterium]